MHTPRYNVIARDVNTNAVMIAAKNDATIIRLIRLNNIDLPPIGGILEEWQQLVYGELIAEIHAPHTTSNDDRRYRLRLFNWSRPSIKEEYYENIITAHESAWKSLRN